MGSIDNDFLRQRRKISLVSSQYSVYSSPNHFGFLSHISICFDKIHKMFTALRLRAPIQSIRQFSSTPPAMKILYIGNMSFNIKEDELRSTFEEFGEVVSAKIITDRLSGRPRGFAFVELVEDSASDLAIEQ